MSNFAATLKMKTFSFPFKDLAISLKDIQEIAPEESLGMELFTDDLSAVLEEAGHFVRAEGGYCIAEDFQSFDQDRSICVNGTSFSVGKIIQTRIRTAEKAALFACTAGPGIREYYHAYLQKGDPLRAFFVDTIGTVAVEKAMDKIQALLREEQERLGLHTSNRYSPGYCGWHVSEQHKLFRFFPVDYCGITLNESSLMNPIKSVSGIIGIGRNIKHEAYSCSICDLSHCIYRKKKAL